MARAYLPMMLIVEMAFNQLAAMLHRNSVEEPPINEIEKKLVRRGQNLLHTAVIHKNYGCIKAILTHRCYKHLVHGVDCCNQTPLALAIDGTWIIYQMYKEASDKNTSQDYIKMVENQLLVEVSTIKLLIDAGARLSPSDASFLRKLPSHIENKIKKRRSLASPNNEPLSAADVTFLNKLTIFVPDSLIIIQEESSGDIIEICIRINQSVKKKDSDPFCCTFCSIL